MDAGLFARNDTELERDRADLRAYLVGAVPGFIVGAAAGFYGADALNDSVDFLREAPMLVRGLVDFVGTIVGGTLGDCAFGFSAMKIYSVARR